MMNKKLAICAAITALIGSAQAEPPDAAKTAATECLTILELAKPAMEQAYRAGHNNFPSDAPFQTGTPANTTYVAGVGYYSDSEGNAVASVEFWKTGNPDIDGATISVRGTGQPDGSVSWICGATSAPFPLDSLDEGRLLILHAYLGAACHRH